MLKLPDRDLSPAALDFLRARQAEIDGKGDFKARAAWADKSWDEKNAVGTGGKAAFEEIEASLKSMCPTDNLCHYCELGEAKDIEHVAPKSYFPQHAFHWPNYLLVCKECNTGQKLDKMYVFAAGDSAEVVRLKRGSEPPTSDFAFVNPRVEDPMAAMQLNLLDFLYYPMPATSPSPSRDQEKATRTIEILNLNGRRGLIRAHENAFTDYKNQLKVYVDVLDANNLDELQKATSGYPMINPADGEFVHQKSKVLEQLQKGFTKTSHPTILREMIRQSARLEKNLQANIKKSGIETWLPRLAQA